MQNNMEEEITGQDKITSVSYNITLTSDVMEWWVLSEILFEALSEHNMKSAGIKITGVMFSDSFYKMQIELI